MRLSQALLVSAAVILVAGCVTPPAGSPPEPIERSERAASATQTAARPAPSANEHYLRAQDAWDDWDSALAEYNRALELDPDFALAYLARARHLRGRGRPQDVVSDYTAAIERDRGLVQAYRERGEVRMWELGDKSGQDDFVAAYEIDPDDIRSALSYAGFIQWDRPAEAMTIYDRMVDLYPQRTDPRVVRGKFRRDRGEYRATLDDFSAALQIGDSSPWIRGEVVGTQLALGDLPAARSGARSLMRDHPDSAEANLVSARIAVLEGNPAGALPLYQTYLEHEWADPRVLLEYAYVNAAQGSERIAMDALERYGQRKDDGIGMRVGLGGIAMLTGSDDAFGILDQISQEASWYSPAILMLAMLEPAGEAPADSARASIIERVRDNKPTPGAFFPSNPDIWIWTSLFLQKNSGSVSPVALP